MLDFHYNWAQWLDRTHEQKAVRPMHEPEGRQDEPCGRHAQSKFGRGTPRVCLGLAALLLASASAVAEDWPQWRGPRRDGISRERGWLAQWPKGGPPRLWQAEVGKGLATVSIAGGRLYTIGNVKQQETVWCLDAATGKVLWQHAYPCAKRFAYNGSAATPTVAGGRVYAHGRAGELACLDAATGKVVWRKNVREEFKLPPQRPDYGNSCSPLILGKLLIVEVGGQDAMVVALDKASGELVWKSVEGGQLAYSSPVAFELGGQPRVAVFHALGLGILDPRDGKELWRHPWKTYDRCSIATPLVAGDKVLISSAYGEGAALVQIGKDKALWKTKELQCHHATCVLWQGHLYGFHGGNNNPGQLRCLDFATGEVKWSQGGMGKGTVLLADGKLIVLSQRGELLVADASPQGFKPISRAKILGGLCWTVPVLCHGRLYCRNGAGTLLCLDLAPAKQSRPGGRTDG